MSSSDTDHLLTFLAAGREFEHDGHTWRIVEVQHGGTMRCERQARPGIDVPFTEAHMRPTWGVTVPAILSVDVLSGQSTLQRERDQMAALQRKLYEQERARPQPEAASVAVYGDVFAIDSPRMRARRESELTSAVQYMMQHAGMAEEQAIKRLTENVTDELARAKDDG